MRKIAFAIMALLLSVEVHAQYDVEIAADMMNREYAQKADSLGRKILTDKGSFSTAIELFKRSATIHKRLDGVKSREYCNSMALLAKCYMRNDQLQDAIKVLTILTDAYKGDPDMAVDYAIVVDNLSLYYAMDNNPEKALEASKEVMHVTDGIEVSKTDKLYILVHAAENYAKMKDYQEAIRLQNRALKLSQQLYGMGSENYINEMKYLQQYYEGAGDNAKAKKTSETIEKLQKPGGGVPSKDELKTAEDCALHRGDAYWCAEYYLTHRLSAEKAFEAGQYAMMWCMGTDELTLEIDERHLKCIGDSPTEMSAYFSGCLLLGQANNVKELTREMERQAMEWTVKHYYQNRDILVKKSPELGKLVECLENGTLDAKLLELIPDE